MKNDPIFISTIIVAALIVLTHLYHRKWKVPLQDGIVIFLGSSGFFTAIQIWWLLLSSAEIGEFKDYKLQTFIGGLAVMWLSVESVVKCLNR